MGRKNLTNASELAGSKTFQPWLDIRILLVVSYDYHMPQKISMLTDLSYDDAPVIRCQILCKDV